MKKVVLVFILILTVIFNTACAKENKNNKKNNENEQSKKNITVYCDESVFPLVNNLVVDYNLNNPEKVNYSILKREDALKKLSSDENSGGNSILIGYVTDIDKNDKKIKKEVIGYDGICIVTDKNSLLESLTTQQLRDIYSGKIIYLKELISDNKKQNVEENINDIKIQPYTFNNTQISLEHYFEEFVINMPVKLHYGSNVGYVSNMTEMKSSTNGKSNIGYINLQYYDNDLKLLDINGIKLNRESLESDLYPLKVPINLLYKEDKKEDIKEFMEYIKGDNGKKIIRKYCINASL